MPPHHTSALGPTSPVMYACATAILAAVTPRSAASSAYLQPRRRGGWGGGWFALPPSHSRTLPPSLTLTHPGPHDFSPERQVRVLGHLALLQRLADHVGK
jgi:hypothetical protein